MLIAFTIPGVPVAQPRARATAINGQARMYEAPKSSPIHAFKAATRISFADAFHDAPIECPVSVSIVCVFPRPKSMTKKTRPNLRCWKDSKPDADNLAKSVCDSLNGLAWRDDSQVVKLVVEKHIASGDEQPRVEVEIRSF